MLRTLALAAALLASALPVHAQKKYGPGVSDTEIRIGQTMPYSGPASAYGVIGKSQKAFFDMINEQGGINGRKINFISLDDGYNPARTVEQTRRLVEQENVLLLFQSLGTPTNSAIHKYVNAKKVPHVLIATGASKWADPKNHPWTIGFNPSYQVEARIYAQHILRTAPGAKIAVLHQNDDFGKDYLAGLKSGLGAKASQIVREVSYEVTDPTVDSQVVDLKGSGADVLLTFATPKFAAQAIRKVGDLGWKPTHYLTVVSASVGAVLAPAGLDKSTGLITALYLVDPSDTEAARLPGMKAWRDWMEKYNKGADLNDQFNVNAYASAWLLVEILKACGDDLTRENVMKQATSLKDVQIPVVIPGIRVTTTPTDFATFGEMQLGRFDGRRWVPFGELLSGR